MTYPVTRTARIPATLLAGLLAAVTGGLPACRPVGSQLEPAPGANELAGDEDAAWARDEAVSIVAEATGWPGDAFITQRVTPLRVTVRNEGDEMMVVRYRDFEVVGTGGRRYHALPPLAVDGTVDTLDPAPDAIAPGLEYDNFALADRYVPAYPGIRRYNGPFAYDHDYYATYYPHWDFEERLPTPEMIAAALPEGIVEPGGFVTGWLYFDKVQDAEREVKLRAELRAVDDERIASVEIPFTAR